MHVGIIGYGYWGPNLLRNFLNVDGVKQVTVCDTRTERLQLVNKQYPYVLTTNDVNSLLASKDVDAIVVATPVFTHFDLAHKALMNGKHVLVEKPLTNTVQSGLELIELAQKMGKVLMVDHTFLYTGAVKKIKELVDTEFIGKVNYFDSTRINLGLFQPDVNVLWDLAPHDISILTHLVKEKPISVNATGISHTANGIENIAYMTVNYQSDFIAHFNCSWSSPVKIRQILIGGDKKMIAYNDIEPSEKLKVYDTGYKVDTDEDKKKIMVDYRTGDIFIPKLNAQEALHGVASDFINSIRSNSTPLASAELGLDVVKVLEAAQRSIKTNGNRVNIDL